jgi:hypothetical protein
MQEFVSTLVRAVGKNMQRRCQVRCLLAFPKTEESCVEFKDGMWFIDNIPALYCPICGGSLSYNDLSLRGIMEMLSFAVLELFVKDFRSALRWLGKSKAPSFLTLTPNGAATDIETMKTIFERMPKTHFKRLSFIKHNNLSLWLTLNYGKFISYSICFNADGKKMRSRFQFRTINAVSPPN